MKSVVIVEDGKEWKRRMGEDGSSKNVGEEQLGNPTGEASTLKSGAASPLRGNRTYVCRDEQSREMLDTSSC